MVSLDYTTLRARVYPARPRKRTRNWVVVLERLFLAWISAVAALGFLVSVALTLVGLISLMQLAYVYTGISLITIVLAAALYGARRQEGR
jgi:hypothetical protein